MAWRDDYRPGSFRGVSFNLKSSTRTGGRRTVLDEFPLRDTPTTQDMGRSARQFKLDMLLIGADYMAARDQLIAALEAAGPGTLVHPFYGELHVAVQGSYSCEESTEQGGRATLSANFVEAGEKPRPDSNPVPGATVNTAADALQGNATDAFVDSFGVAGYAGFVADGAIDALNDVTRAINEAGGLLVGAQIIGERVTRLAAAFQELILAPGNLAASLLEIVRGISNTADPFVALRAQMALFNLGRTSKATRGTGYVTPSRAQVAINQAAIQTLIERVAVSEAARLATGRPLDANGQPFSGLTYDSRDMAVTVRDQVLAELERQQLLATRASYWSLARLASELVRDMNSRSASLAPLTRVTPATTQPALLIAHRLYGDAQRADEIVARNRIKHPGFVAGGTTLEVLKDD